MCIPAAMLAPAKNTKAGRQLALNDALQLQKVVCMSEQSSLHRWQAGNTFCRNNPLSLVHAAL